MAYSAGLRELTRRRFAKLGLAVVAGGLSLVRGRTTRASVTRTVYVFDPMAEPTSAGSRCATCAACRRHAAYKVFASRAAAEARRAHPHCRCAIKVVSVAPADFVWMFGESDGSAWRGEFDVRWVKTMGGLEMPA